MSRLLTYQIAMVRRNNSGPSTGPMFHLMATVRSILKSNMGYKQTRYMAYCVPARYIQMCSVLQTIEIIYYNIIP